jgi:nicotinamidase/pyrazinamidase
MKKFLVVIDTQYDFVMPDGALYVGTAEEIIVPGIKFLANLNPDEYTGALFTYDTHTPKVYEGSSESEMFPIHCVKKTPGWANVFNDCLVHKNIPVFRLEKGVFNMWEEDGLKLERFDRSTSIVRPVIDLFIRDEFFDHMNPNEVTIEVFGVASDFCVKWAVDGFVKRGFKVNVVAELCRGITLSAPHVFNETGYENVTLI